MKNKNREIDILENPVIGGIKQWILIRGRNSSNPVLLLLQAGPGFPMISESDSFEKILKLEERFTVVYWDQRGCGKSYNNKIPVASMSLQQMVADTNEVTEFLKGKLNKKKIYITGFSLGGSVALIAASKYPENYFLVVGVGIDVVMKEAEEYAYQFAISEAEIRKQKRAMAQLKKIGPPPHTLIKNFQVRVKWITNFGGINLNETFFSLLMKTMRNLFSSSFYSAKDILKTLRGINFSQKYLLPNIVSLDLFETVKSLDTKIYFIQGTKDAAAPPALAKKYFDFLNAPKGKIFISFNNSAHMPHIEEPEKFRALLVNEICELSQKRLAPVFLQSVPSLNLTL